MDLTTDWKKLDDWNNVRKQQEEGGRSKLRQTHWNVETIRQSQWTSRACKWARDPCFLRLVTVTRHLKHWRICFIGSSIRSRRATGKIRDRWFYKRYVVSEDTDPYFYEGSQNLYSDFNTRITRKYRCVINRSTAAPFVTTLHGDSLRVMTSFCGTDYYIAHLSDVDPKTVFDLHA